MKRLCVGVILVLTAVVLQGRAAFPERVREGGPVLEGPERLRPRRPHPGQWRPRPAGPTGAEVPEE